MKTLYEYITEIDSLVEQACNNLKPKQFEQLLDFIYHLPDDYEE